MGVNGLLAQSLRGFIAEDDALTVALKERGKELGQMFDPNNKNSFISQFQGILQAYLDEGGKLWNLFSPDSKNSYSSQLKELLKEYFGPETARIFTDGQSRRRSTPFGRI